MNRRPPLFHALGDAGRFHRLRIGRVGFQSTNLSARLSIETKDAQIQVDSRSALFVSFEDPTSKKSGKGGRSTKKSRFLSLSRPTHDGENADHSISCLQRHQGMENVPRPDFRGLF
jgi:uncharacterized protein (DUF1684 family)